LDIIQSKSYCLTCYRRSTDSNNPVYYNTEDLAYSKENIRSNEKNTQASEGKKGSEATLEDFKTTKKFSD